MSVKPPSSGSDPDDEEKGTIKKKDNSLASKDSDSSGRNAGKKRGKSGKGVKISSSAESIDELTPSKAELRKQFRRRDTPLPSQGSKLSSAEVFSKHQLMESEKAGPSETNQGKKKKLSRAVPKVVQSHRNSEDKGQKSHQTGTFKRTNFKMERRSNKLKTNEDKHESVSRVSSQKSQSSWISEITNKTDILPENYPRSSPRESLDHKKGRLSRESGLQLRNSSISRVAKDVKQTDNPTKTQRSPSSEEKSRRGG